eukprot:7266537-Alexandrium_andersonii.AAC.1
MHVQPPSIIHPSTARHVWNSLRDAMHVYRGGGSELSWPSLRFERALAMLDPTSMEANELEMVGV